MLSVAIRNTIPNFIEAIIAEDSSALNAMAMETITRAEDASELIGRIGLVAMHGGDEGHTVLTLSAASLFCRWLIGLRHTLGDDPLGWSKGIPLVTQTLLAAAPAIRAGKDAPPKETSPLFPSGLPENETVASALHKAIVENNPPQIERLLFGLYGTGADYRAISIRIYDSISQTFQEGGHVQQYAVRGIQLLDAVEWGTDTAYFLHWITPHMTIHEPEPAWIEDIHGFLSEAQHNLASYRTRLAAPKNMAALPLRTLLLSEASTPQICQGVYDALITNGASAGAVSSVIALAAADLLQTVKDDERDLFIQIAHGLLHASANRVIYTQVQEVEALPALFTAAAYVNALHKERGIQPAQVSTTRTTNMGGGLIAPALLEMLSAQIDEQDVSGALSTARRYVQLGHDARALFGVIGLGLAQTAIVAEQGHPLQIAQAAGEAFLEWPKELHTTNIDSFLLAALRAAAFATRTTIANT